MPIGLKGNVDGSGAVQIGGSDAITISTGLNTTFAGTAAVPTGTLYPIVSGTAVASTSGTSIDFTGIPSWVKRITVMFNGVSTSGGSNPLVQIGAGSVTTSGYSSVASRASAGTAEATSTVGFNINGNIGTNAISGTMTLVLVSGAVWVSSHTGGSLTNSTTFFGGGTVTLGGTLDRVRITTVNGTDTFDAGSINILYE